MTRDDFIAQVEESQGALRRFLTALCCGDTSAADDIAQEAYLRAWLSIGSLSRKSAFKAWVFKIAYHEFLRSRSATTRYCGLEQAGESAAVERADAGFAYQPLHDALARISPRERSAILLYYLQGYSVKEIASITDATAETVRQQLSRGRRHLKHLLQD